MCGRFAFYSPSEATAALFGASGSVDLKPRYNIAPTQDIAAICLGTDGDRELKSLRWGLVPFWAKDPKIGNRMINARAETVAEKPSFRTAYRKRRCLVLADGFYEWHKEGSGKTPYFISLVDGSPFAFAGLWEHWQDKETDETLDSATIITTAANEFMTPLHHRMPITLDPARADLWMAGGDDIIVSAVQDALNLRAWPVGREVNNPRNEGVNLIASLGEGIEA